MQRTKQTKAGQAAQDRVEIPTLSMQKITELNDAATGTAQSLKDLETTYQETHTEFKGQQLELQAFVKGVASMLDISDVGHYMIVDGCFVKLTDEQLAMIAAQENQSQGVVDEADTADTE